MKTYLERKEENIEIKVSHYKGTQVPDRKLKFHNNFKW